MSQALPDAVLERFFFLIKTKDEEDMGVKLCSNPQDNICSQSLTSCGAQQCYHSEGPSVLLCFMKNENVNVGAQVAWKPSTRTSVARPFVIIS